MRILTFLILFICSSSFGQTNTYQNLLDTALNGDDALFVHSKPLKITRLDPKEMWEYVEYLKELSDQSLDTLMFSQIIQHTKIADTTLWTDTELPNFLLVTKREESASKIHAIQKFKRANDKAVKAYKKQINKFNATEATDRNLYYFSRPVFDNSKTFAIVQWDNGHSYLGGGGGVILYQLQSDKSWREIGIIKNWKY
jgi:hypothetical protein